ncbi:unnamed protein product [Adineta steineri]|uniref:Uncharacterized protein n=1 Tax=Adineta steineri TaxID=433720 RepID=A0A819X3N9_9BILA|nr:unnamed protein product [Adineta steineri]
MDISSLKIRIILSKSICLYYPYEIPPCSTATCCSTSGCIACYDGSTFAYCRYASDASSSSTTPGDPNFSPRSGYLIYDTNGRYSGNPDPHIPCTTDVNSGINDFNLDNADNVIAC